MNGMKLYMALAVWMFAAPAWATCGVGGYWGSECGPQTTGRVCLGIELNPAYVDVAVQRWQKFTGKQAVLDGDGTPYDDLKTKDR